MADVLPSFLATMKSRWHQERQQPTTPPSVDRSTLDLLQLHRTNLEVRLRSIDEPTLQTDSQKRTYAIVSETLKRWNKCTGSDAVAAAPKDAGGTRDWDEVYKIERMIGLLLAGMQLRQEIRLRLDELTAERAPEADRLRAEYMALIKPAAGDPAPPVDDAVLRSLLLRVMEALHWYAKRKHLTRPARKQATKIILICVIVTFVLVILPYLLINIDYVPATASINWKWWSLFALYTALIGGLMGAFFSRLVNLQRNGDNMSLEEAYLHRELSYTMLRAGVGMCGALIVYFFLKSGLVDGALFPKFNQLAMELVEVPEGKLHMAFVVPSRDLALLTVWCFVAGFSEALVPSILAGAERQLSGSSGPRS
jgi:hypothetical protein